MRQWGIIVDRGTSLHQQRAPQDVPVQAAPPPVPGLSDSLAVVFQRACQENRLDAAADLLSVLEIWAKRRPGRTPREREVEDIRLKRMRAELERRHVTQGTQPVKT